jgi:hypothetical protein
MLSWSINNDVISQLAYKNYDNIIHPWGVETADSSSFFSMQKGVGWRYTECKKTIDFDEESYHAVAHCKMTEGEWEICDKAMCIKSSDKLVRKLSLKTYRDSIFMDFVMRFRFSKDIFDVAKIGNLALSHNNTNVYYQLETSKVELQSKEGFNLHIDVKEVKSSNAFKQVAYVRDAPGEWVVHIRLLPQAVYKEVIKICTSWADTRPLPLWISKPLLSLPFLKKYLWYKSELNPYRSRLMKKYLNFNAYPMTWLAKNSEIRLQTELCIENRTE